MNWEALQVALDSVRINTIAGRSKQAESELLYLIDALWHLREQLQRTEVVE